MRLQSDVPGRADACELSVPRHGIVSEGSGLALHAAANHFSAGGQGSTAAGQAGACLHTM